MAKLRTTEDPWRMGLWILVAAAVIIVILAYIRPAHARPLEFAKFGRLTADCAPDGTCVPRVDVPADYDERRLTFAHAAIESQGGKDYVVLVMEFERDKPFATAVFGRSDIDAQFRDVRQIRCLNVHFHSEGGSTRQIAVEL